MSGRPQGASWWNSTMETKAAVDVILATENLTDRLEPQDGQWLLDWAISQTGKLIDGLYNEQVALGKLNALIAVVRKLNQIVGSRTTKTPDALAADVRIFAMMYANAYSRSFRSLSAESLNRVAGNLSTLSARESLENLIAFAQSHNSHH